MSTQLRLAVVMPVCNEAATLREIVRKVLQLPVQLELIIVDDGSRDGSADIADALAKEDARVRVIHKENGGKGSAVRVGIRAAAAEFVVIQDADLEYDPTDLVRMLDARDVLKTDVIYGSRRLERRSPTVEWKYYFGGVFLSFVTNLLFGSNLTDEPTCYKMWKRELIQSIPLEGNGFEFCPEVTAKVLRRGYRIPEIQIQYQPRTTEAGKKIRARDGLIAVWTLLKHRVV